MANLKDVYESHADKFNDESKKSISTSFETIQKSLGDLGYDVLINPREKNDFVDYTRFSQVIGERDTHKATAIENGVKLADALKAAKGNTQLEGKLQTMIDQNNQLQKDLEASTLNVAVFSEAKDAHDPGDIVAFIDRSKVTVTSDGRFLGLKEEISRLRVEKPHLFKANQNNGQGGNDNQNGGQGNNTPAGGMNNLIRRAAGHRI